MGYLCYGGIFLVFFIWVSPTKSRYAGRKRFDIDMAKRIELSDLEGLDNYPVATDVPEVEMATMKQPYNFGSNLSRVDPVKGFTFYEKRFDPFMKRFDPHKNFYPFTKRFDPYEKRFDPYVKRFDPYWKRLDRTYGNEDEADVRDKRFDPYSKRFDIYKRFDPYSKRLNALDQTETSSKRFEPFKRFEPYSKRFDIFKRFDPFPYSSSLSDYDFYPEVSKRFDPSYLEQYWGRLNAKRNIFDPYAYHVGFGR
ncbi:hypothetical protein GCK32_011302 [Trichostrongylus colubriformis]|uniref:Uncharacterized protein n=1 Tax=Trichostrongylus colubriformis TaxID=6319 RepID=A0AAN8FAY6_TRICO